MFWVAFNLQPTPNNYNIENKHHVVEKLYIWPYGDNCTTGKL